MKGELRMSTPSTFDSNPKFTFTTYNVRVDRTLPFAEMIVAGNFDRVHEGITHEHFPLEVNGAKEVELHLVNFGGLSIMTEGVLAEFDHQGFRPGTLPELCALPDLQDGYPIVALGSRWYQVGSVAYVAILQRSIYAGNLLEVAFDSAIETWNAHNLYLAASK